METFLTPSMFQSGETKDYQCQWEEWMFQIRKYLFDKFGGKPRGMFLVYCQTDQNFSHFLWHLNHKSFIKELLFNKCSKFSYVWFVPFHEWEYLDGLESLRVCWKHIFAATTWQAWWCRNSQLHLRRLILTKGCVIFSKLFFLHSLPIFLHKYYLSLGKLRFLGIVFLGLLRYCL